MKTSNVATQYLHEVKLYVYVCDSPVKTNHVASCAKLPIF